MIRLGVIVSDISSSSVSLRRRRHHQVVHTIMVNVEDSKTETKASVMIEADQIGVRRVELSVAQLSQVDSAKLAFALERVSRGANEHLVLLTISVEVTHSDALSEVVELLR